jgi:membrane protease YdiL (CAAX protease family)
MKPTRARVYWEEAAWPWRAAAILIALDIAGLAGARFVVGWDVHGQSRFDGSDPVMAIVGNWSVVTRALLALTFAMYFLGRGVPPRAFGLTRSCFRRRTVEFGKSLAVILPLAAGFLMIGVLLYRAAGRRDDISAPMTFGGSGQVWPWIWIFVVTLPIVEGFLYRGILHPVLRRHMGVGGAVAIGGMTFGLLHWFYGIDLAALTAYALGGAALAWVYERTGSLFFPWLLHVATNLAGLWTSLHPGLFEALRT